MSDTIKSENIKLDINKLNIGKADVSKADVSKADVSKANNIKPENLLQSDELKNIYSYLKPVLMVLLLYLTTTMLEWFYHCKVMHNEKYDPGHIRHHKSVHADMHLDDDEFYDKDIRMSNIHSISIFAVANILYYFI